MGGGVVMKALIAEPGLVQAGSLWASVSSLEGENFNQFIRPDGDARADRARWPERAVPLVLGGLILVLASAAIVLRRKEREPEENANTQNADGDPSTGP